MDILAAVTARLSALGYTVNEADNMALDYNIKKAEATLRAATNQPEVPEGLFYVWADMAAGLFLTDKKASGALAEVFDFSAPAKSISEGDTSVSFAIADGGTFETQFDAITSARSTLSARSRRASMAGSTPPTSRLWARSRSAVR